jgi:uncharacterized protein YcbK (DUF882 family)
MPFMITRRDFIKACVAATALFPFRNVFASMGGDRALDMYNIHTGEKLNIRYCSSGDYDRNALEKINYFLRCHYTNEVKEIDVGVLDLLCDIRDSIGSKEDLQIISGYRSPAYNQYLVSLGRHVSRNSLHMQGLAIDFAVDGVGNERLARIAKSFRAGGVGTYADFVHVDVGRVRYW